MGTVVNLESSRYNWYKSLNPVKVWPTTDEDVGPQKEGDSHEPKRRQDMVSCAIQHRLWKVMVYCKYSEAVLVWDGTVEERLKRYDSTTYVNKMHLLFGSP